ncbi:MAG: hypothetical protein HEP71_12435 [Roseivirga sp.]|nr:hypothetical protein [Roseivirga sp.]
MNISGLYGFLMFVLINTCTVSCQSGASESRTADSELGVQTYTGVRFVQIDSIMIDVIGNFNVYDYHPQSGLFLGGDIGGYLRGPNQSTKRNELGHLVINRNGEILHQFNHTDNGPEGHGGRGIDHFFLSPSTIGVYSPKSLFRYNIDGTFIGKHKEINTLDPLGISFHRVGFSVDGKHIAMGMSKRMGSSEDSVYHKGRALWFYDFGKAENDLTTEAPANPLLASYGFPDNPIYSQESKMHHSPLPPRMALNRGTHELLSLYPEIPEISVYDMKSGRLKESYPLNPKHFEFKTEKGMASGALKGFESLAWINRGGSMANSNYQDLIQLGEYTLLRYNTAIPKSIVEEIIVSGGPKKTERWPVIRKKHYRSVYQLFKGTERVLPDFELSALAPRKEHLEFHSNASIRGKIIGGNGLAEIFVFIPNNGEEERDYELIRVFKMELVEE